MIRISQVEKIKIDPSFYREKISVFEIDESKNISIAGLTHYLKTQLGRETKGKQKRGDCDPSFILN